MSGGFTAKYFRIVDYDGNGFSVMKQSTNATFYSASNVSVQPCGTGDTGCAQDGTGPALFQRHDQQQAGRLELGRKH